MNKSNWLYRVDQEHSFYINIVILIDILLACEASIIVATTSTFVQVVIVVIIRY